MYEKSAQEHRKHALFIGSCPLDTG